MAKTVVGLFDDAGKAEQAVNALTAAGFRRDDISVVARDEVRGERTGTEGTHTGTARDTGSDIAGSAGTGAGVGAAVGGVGGLLAGLGLFAIPGFGPILAAGPIAAALTGAVAGAAVGGLVGGLVGIGIPKEHAEAYAEGVRRGGYLVVVNAADEKADQAADILDQFNPIDIEQRSAQWRAAGWQAYEDRPHTGPSLRDEEVIPISEEQISVGKRRERTGVVRVHSFVTERPVEEQVTLTEETVRVERRPVDRPVEAGEAGFQERTVEVEETAERPVVAKESRVVEEIVVGTEEQTRTETVKDTVRRTEVEVEDEDETAKKKAPTVRR